MPIWRSRPDTCEGSTTLRSSRPSTNDGHQ
jgi:hypothetical protein